MPHRQLKLPQEEPAALLEVTFPPDREAILTLHSANMPFYHTFGLEPAMTGQSLAELFYQDVMTIGDWVEFLTKAKLTSARDRRRKEYQRKILQRFRCNGLWFYTRLRYRVDSNLLLAVFEAPPDDESILIEQEILKELKQNLWSATVVSSSGLWEIDLGTATVYLSRQMSAMLGLGNTAKMLTLENFFSSVHREDRDTMLSMLDNISQDDMTLTQRHLKPDGTLVHLLSYAIPTYDRRGEMSHILGRSREIPEQHPEQSGWEAWGNQFLELIQNPFELHMVVSSDGICKYASPSSQAILGMPPEELVNNPCDICFPQDNGVNSVLSFFLGIYGQQPGQHLECRMFHADGREIWLDLTVAPLPDAEGKTGQIFLSGRDITRHKQAEKQTELLRTKDPLTGALNRASFEEELERLSAHPDRSMGIVMADVNGLRLINNVFGHQKGDQLLREAAQVIQEAADGPSLLARISGTEFALLLYDTTVEKEEATCQSIQAYCETTRRRMVPLSMAVGSAHCRGPDMTIFELYKKAESRMLGSKSLEKRSIRGDVISSLKETLRSRNVETADHLERMEGMVSMVGRQLGLSRGEFDRLILLASMHDVGKLSVSDNIINKPGKLTDEEYLIVQSHCEAGMLIAQASRELSAIAEEIACHHERWDGRGYPYGRAGNEIPLLARIISVVDTYDVMTHKRVYKEASTHEEAIAELHRCSGSQFDPEIVSLFDEIFGSFDSVQMMSFTDGTTHSHNEPPHYLC